ncbi:MAG: SPOR domain-containing protein [Desulfurellaceae bacterium]|nr:SPOR domain-containing protein [Desulfurellaceae bacterium]
MAQRRYRLQVSAFEGSLLVVSCLFASLLIFVFGIYVGKEVQAQKTVEQATPLRVPVGRSKTELLARSPALPLPSPQAAVPVQQPESPEPPAPLPLLATAEPPAAAPEAKPSVTAPPRAQHEKPPAKPRRWSVQVQATTRQQTARQTAKRLRQQGYSPSVSKVVRQGRVWYRVRVGPFSEELEAKAAISRFRHQKTFAQAYPVLH